MRRAYLLILLTACTGDIVPSGITGLMGGGPSGPPGTDPMSPEPPPVAAITELRRLTVRELDLTLQALVGDTSHAAVTLMPGDTTAPFDNDYSTQAASAIYVEAAERLAQQIAADTLASPTRRASILPCTPANDDDVACLEQFIRSFGRRALRRPLSDAEVTDFMSLHMLARQRGTIDDSLALVIERLLMDPEFLFRVEVGTPVQAALPNTFALGPYELASRLAFFLQGRAPDDALLDAAAAGQLDAPDTLRAAAQALLDAPEGHAQVDVFHAMWLGYLALPYDPTFNEEVVTETQTLVNKIVFDDQADYSGLFTAEQTYVDDALAQHYGLPPTGEAGFHWVAYGSSGRKGILSHASLLANGVKQTDTSPTLRGKWIRNRLFCQVIPPPPPNVVVDVPPPMAGGAVCKKDRYAEHDQVASCAACHLQMDPVGFGLEQYDRTGAFRSVEADHPECAITGDGAVQGVGNFNGPAGLADLMVSAGAIDGCAVTQVFRFASGRTDAASDAPLIRDLTRDFTGGGRQFTGLLLDIVSHPTFAQRRLEVP